MWLKKDDRFPNHRKIRRLSDGAYRLHDTAMCYAAHDETDGHIARDDVDEMEHGPRLRRNIAALVGAGLWHADGHDCSKCPQPRDPDGWVLHDFLDYNMSHAQQEKAREKNRARQAEYRAKRLGIADDEPSNGVTNAVTNGPVTRLSHDPVPGRSVPGRTGPIEDDSPSSSSSPDVPRDTATRMMPRGVA